MMESTNKPFAYVTLLMCNPSYVYGSLTLAYSLRLTNTKHDIICMVTDDLYNIYKDVLQTVYDKVISIKYLSYTGRLISQKQYDIYGDWYKYSYTKWVCLNLTEYAKICFLDSDLIIIRNIDDVFRLKTPAACFVNSWSEYGYNSINYYKNIKYGELIPDSIIRKGLKDSFTLVAHCVILEPIEDSINKFHRFMTSNQTNNDKCISMLDEKAIAKFQLYIGNQWTQMSYQYNTIPWKMSKTNISIDADGKKIFNQPYILHYFNKKKPWMTYRNDWIDLGVWWSYWDALNINIKNPLINDLDINIRKFSKDVKEDICTYCIMLNNNGLNFNTDHTLINSTITCPQLLCV